MCSCLDVENRKVLCYRCRRFGVKVAKSAILLKN
jgi:hypothetical protein